MAKDKSFSCERDIRWVMRPWDFGGWETWKRTEAFLWRGAWGELWDHETLEVGKHGKGQKFFWRGTWGESWDHETLAFKEHGKGQKLFLGEGHKVSYETMRLWYSGNMEKVKRFSLVRDMRRVMRPWDFGIQGTWKRTKVFLGRGTWGDLRDSVGFTFKQASQLLFNFIYFVDPLWPCSKCDAFFFSRWFHGAFHGGLARFWPKKWLIDELLEL